RGRPPKWRTARDRHGNPQPGPDRPAACRPQRPPGGPGVVSFLRVAGRRAAAVPEQDAPDKAAGPGGAPQAPRAANQLFAGLSSRPAVAGAAARAASQTVVETGRPAVQEPPADGTRSVSGADRRSIVAWVVHARREMRSTIAELTICCLACRAE